MAVYCPMYDPTEGWYILSYGPQGFEKKLIISPLSYYQSMNVKPPIGSKFTQQEYENFALNTITPISTFDPLPSAFAVSAPASSQAVTKPASAFDDLSDLQDQFVLPSFFQKSNYPPPFNSSTISTAFTEEISAPKKTEMSDVVSLNEYANLIHSFPNQIGASFKSHKFSDSSAHPSAKSGPKSSRNQYKYSNLQTSSSMPHHPESPISSDIKHKYKILPLSSLPYAPQFSMPSDSQYKYKSQTLSFSPQLSIPSGCEYKYDDLQYASTSSNSSDYLHCLPSTSPEIGKNLPPINILHADDSQAIANSSKVSQNPMSPPIYKHPHMANEMKIDEFDESALGEDKYEMTKDV